MTVDHHHRLHHRGKLGIEGDADEPDGVVFTDDRGGGWMAAARLRAARPPGKWVP